MGIIYLEGRFKKATQPVKITGENIIGSGIDHNVEGETLIIQ